MVNQIEKDRMDYVIKNRTYKILQFIALDLNIKNREGDFLSAKELFYDALDFEHCGNLIYALNLDIVFEHMAADCLENEKIYKERMSDTGYNSIVKGKFNKIIELFVAAHYELSDK